MSDVKRELTIDRLMMEAIRKVPVAYMIKSFSSINNTPKSIEIAVDRYNEDNEEFDVPCFMEWITGQLEGCGRLIGTMDYEDLSLSEQKKVYVV